ncbi:MAG TPA: DUF4190 domain-containing protein [Clostridia bacterium]|nr:DUF4190 domain-containing protein [Clostridia bacterium]
MKECPVCRKTGADSDTYCKYCGCPFPPPQKEQNEYAGYQTFPGQPYYGYTPYRQYPPEQSYSGLAIASMILGILSLPLFCFYGSGVITAILSIIFGFVAKSKISTGASKGFGMAITGIVLGIVTLTIGIIVVLLISLSLISLSGMGNYFNQYSSSAGI